MKEKDRNLIIATNIKRLIKENKITQKKLANEIGISPSTMSDYMNLRSNPSHGVIQKIADYFGVMKSDIDTTYKENQNFISTIYNQLTLERKRKVDTFAEKQLEEQNQDNIVDFPAKKLVNGRSTAAGSPINGDNEDLCASTIIVDTMEIPEIADEIVTIAGDSMEPTYRERSQVFVHWQPEVEQGEVAIVSIEDEGVTCKKVYYDKKNREITLRSINDRYNDRVFPMDKIRIIGKVL